MEGTKFTKASVAHRVQKGWGYAMLNTSRFQADSGCGLTVGRLGRKCTARK